MNLKQFEVASRIFSLNKTMHELFGETYPDRTKLWRSVLLSTMNQTGNKNPLSAVLPIAKRLQEKGENPMLLLSVAVDLSREKDPI